jgi:CubicO group peptidase (beta-lactamase class C family)
MLIYDNLSENEVVKSSITEDKLKAFEEKVKLDYSNIVSINIVKNEEIIYEKAFKDYKINDSLHVASVTKSFLSAIVGILIDRKLIESIDQKVLDFFTEYKTKDNKKQDITLRNLLTMTAPYKYKTEPFKKLCCSDDWTEYALNLLGGKDKIGDFKYSTAGAHIISSIITKVTGNNALAFANENLFAPLSISPLENYFVTLETYFSFLKDKNKRVWIVDTKNNSAGGWGLSLNVREMSKFGQLYLSKGVFNNNRIISEDWINDSWKNNKNSYGYLWWLIDNKYKLNCAIGDGGNIICVIPELNVVISILCEFKPRVKDRIELITNTIIPMIK